MYTAYYRGLGLSDRDGIFGKQFYKVEYRDCPDCGVTVVQFATEGYNNFAGYHPNGTLSSKGQCWVSLTGYPPKPVPDIHKIENGQFFSPDGSIVSEIANGTGVQTLYHPNGRLKWRLELDNFNRVRHSWWDESGRVISEMDYHAMQ